MSYIPIKVMSISERITKREEERIRGEMDAILNGLDLKVHSLPEGANTHFLTPSATTTYLEIRGQIVDAIVASRLHLQADKAIEQFMAKVEKGGSK